jgi:hypothetical protein
MPEMRGLGDISRFLTAVRMKMALFWDVTSCGLVEVDRRFRSVYCVHDQGDYDVPHKSSCLV